MKAYNLGESKLSQKIGRRIMPKSVERLIEDWRQLDLPEQDLALQMLLDIVDQRRETAELDDETREAVLDGAAQADRGEFATEKEIETLFARYRK
jgi:hypothetical protein